MAPPLETTLLFPLKVLTTFPPEEDTVEPELNPEEEEEEEMGLP